MKIAVITCYYQPDYVRAATLRQAIADNPEHTLITVKNTHKGLFRYPEIIGRLLWVRLRHRPQAYLLTFRAYEILPFANLLTWPKKMLYDEFLNPLEWLNEDRKEWWARFIPKNLLKHFYKLLLKRPAIILTDTPAHADYSQEILGMQSNKFYSLPVGADEAIFKPSKTHYSDDVFTVFYYGTMLPLHGLDIVLQAFEQLQDLPVRLIFSGGDSQTIKAVKTSQQQGARIEHHKWIPYTQIPSYVAKARLTLGGPFGDTKQASMVVTGKTYQFLACGAAVLVGKTKAQTKFVDEQNCLSVPLGDAKALADKIRWAYAHPQQLNKIRLAGQKLYNQEFSSAALSRQMATILEQLS